MPTTSPHAVVAMAVLMPWLSRTACSPAPASPSALKARMRPYTVPNRPTIVDRLATAARVLRRRRMRSSCAAASPPMASQAASALLWALPAAKTHASGLPCSPEDQRSSMTVRSTPTASEYDRSAVMAYMKAAPGPVKAATR